MKTDELVISEDYRYYVTRCGHLAVLLCDLRECPVDVPALELKKQFVFLIEGNIQQVRSDGFLYDQIGSLDSACGYDIVGCLYFATGYQEAKLELQANRRQFVCCDESDVVGAVYDPKTGMAHSHGGYVSISGEPSHSLAKSIAESIACGDGKWLEATAQSLQSRREAVQRRIDERQEFPQYWTTRTHDMTRVPVAYVVRTGPEPKDWHMVNKSNTEFHGGAYAHSLPPWSAEGRTRITKEQADALLDKKTCDVDWVTQDVVPVRAGIDEVAWFWHDTQKLGPWDRAAGVWGEHVHGDVISNATLHVRCLRKDLPVKPKAKCSRDRVTELLHEVKMLAEGDVNYVQNQLVNLTRVLNR